MKCLLTTATFWEDRLMDKAEYLERITELLQILQVAGLNVTIKTHPRERNDRNYLSIIMRNRLDKVTLEKGKGKDFLYNLMVKCDFIMTLSESVGMEAQLMGKPCHFIDIYKNLEDNQILKLLKNKVKVIL